MEKFDYSFLTGSSYTGAYKPKMHTMEGFGVYKYPDGSFYRGLFKGGKFHGYGRISLSPRKFIIKGLFEDGELIEVEEILFNDGLRVNTSLANDKLNFKRWKYGNDNDRRFFAEHCHGIQAVGPESYTTSETPSRKLSADTFDAGEGIFKPSTGFIVHRVFPFNPYRFVCCKEECDYMTKHYREGPHDRNMKTSTLPIPEFRKKILITNLKAMLLLDRLTKCACFTDEFKEIKSFFVNRNVDAESSLSTSDVTQDATSTHSSKQAPVTSSESSESCFSSLTAEHLIENLEKICREEIKPEKIQFDEADSTSSSISIRGRTDTLTSRISMDLIETYV